MKYIYSKLTILMILILSSGYSQDTTIELEFQVARFVIEDLIKGDAATEELFLTQDQITQLNKKIVIQDSIIFKKDAVILNYEQIIGTRNNQLQLQESLKDQLKADLKKQKLRTKLTGGLGAALLIGLAVIL